MKVDFTGNYASNVQDGPTASTATTAMSTAYMYSVWAFRPVSPTGSDMLNQMYDEGVNMTEDYRLTQYILHVMNIVTKPLTIYNSMLVRITNSSKD